MTFKFPALNKLALVLAATALVTIGIRHGRRPMRRPRRQYDDREQVYYGPDDPNVSYQPGLEHPGLRHQALLARRRH